MLDAFLGATADEITARIQAAASQAAGGPTVVRVAEEAYGSRNVGIDLPRGRRSAAEGRAMRRRVREALEAAGVALVETAIAPTVAGDMRGTVRVREGAPSRGDAAHVAQPPRQ